MENKKHQLNNVVLKCVICGNDAIVVIDEQDKPACWSAYCEKHQK